uniref:arylamine N-acetyltransferase n=1 Tax=Ciona savignyi TaxID=51511 RepID=H2ZLG5_CIOSA
MQKYLKRINYNQEIRNDSTTLTKLCKQHMEHIPFENLDMFGGKRRHLDFQRVYNDLVLLKRGGFCYEHNGLFNWVLLECGYKVKMVQAAAYIDEVVGYGPDFDHLALLVTCCDGSEWLADVGWGGNSFTHPLKFELTTEQTQPNGVYRLHKLDDNFIVLQKRKKTLIQMDNVECSVKKEKNAIEWESIYKFDLVPRKWEDFKEMFDYQHDSEESFLKNNMLCAKQRDTGSIVVVGWSAHEKIYMDPLTEKYKWKRKQSDQNEVKKILKDHFQIDIDFDLQPNSKYKFV